MLTRVKTQKLSILKSNGNVETAEIQLILKKLEEMEQMDNSEGK